MKKRQESITQTISRIEKQKGRSLTSQEFLAIVNHELAHRKAEQENKT